jgi:hypothetical protein
MFLGSKARPVTDDSAAICEQLPKQCGILTSLNPIGLQGLLRGYLYFY